MKDNSRKYALIITVIFVGFLAVGLISTRFLPDLININFGRTKTGGALHGGKMLDLPRVIATIENDEGEPQDISANISLEINEDKIDDYDNEILQSKLIDAMGNLDYSKIKEEDGSLYIKKEMLKELEEYVDIKDIKAIYFRQLSTGPYMFADTEEERKSDKSNVEELLEGFSQTKKKRK